jgi:hypothetical protein
MWEKKILLCVPKGEYISRLQCNDFVFFGNQEFQCLQVGYHHVLCNCWKEYSD